MGPFWSLHAFIEQLKNMAGPKCKIVCTSHSPFVLAPLPVDSVRVVQLDSEGHTVVDRLSAHPEWSKGKDEMTAAEFWLYAGDAWRADAKMSQEASYWFFARDRGPSDEFRARVILTHWLKRRIAWAEG